MTTRLVELFAGVGAFRLGLEQALGRERVRTVYANDNSRLACEWYQRWHGDTPDCCDVRTVERRYDLLEFYDDEDGALRRLGNVTGPIVLAVTTFRKGQTVDLMEPFFCGRLPDYEDLGHGVQ